MFRSVDNILKENDRRNELINAPFNPVTGEGSILERKEVKIPDFPIPVQYLPLPMLKEPYIKKMIKAKTFENFLRSNFDEVTQEVFDKAVEQYIRIRNKHDFAFWAATLAYIKSKLGGEDILFKLNRAQRKLIEKLERMRLRGVPIRLILLKARQWGGSTAVQIYMSWIQIVHKKGLNSLIVAHVKDASAEVKGMFDKLIDAYPQTLLYEMGEEYSDTDPKMVGVPGTTNIDLIPSRNCKIKIGTAERPDSARGGDSALVHLTEVAFWKKTEGKTPTQIVRSATSGVANEHLTLIVYESTANGTGNFFHREYVDAKNGRSMFEALFIAWFEIERYSLKFTSEDEKRAFAKELFENREGETAHSDRDEAGKYYWRLWTLGATLEALHWYRLERSKYTDHGDMAAEYPSDDIEAFQHSGAKVFDKYKVEELRGGCRSPKWIGEISAFGDDGLDALKDIMFVKDHQGRLSIWEKPEIFDNMRVRDRYLVVVDIGGRGAKADWSVITVFDRYWMMEGDKPAVVAQWYGHIDHDLLAWKSAQIAAYYDNALLVIESNTLETTDKDRDVDGDLSHFILNQIKGVYENLYARKQSEQDIKEKKPVRYGFHTNTSTKPMIISTLIKCVREGLYIERDENAIDELLKYERKQNGAYGAVQGEHDDRLMTRAIGLHICFHEMDLPKIIEINSVKPKKRKAVSAATLG